MNLEDEQQEPVINVNGIPVPISLAGAAVRRCISGIQAIDKILAEQGFASDEDLRAIRAGLTGEALDEAGTKDAPIPEAE